MVMMHSNGGNDDDHDGTDHYCNSHHSDNVEDHYHFHNYSEVSMSLTGGKVSPVN